MHLRGSSVPKWRIACQSVRGSSHERAGLPNQDAMDWLPQDDATAIVVLAISDGHGSAKSFRSDIGSKFAVTVATREMLHLVQQQRNTRLTPTAAKRAAEDMLPQSLVREWKKKVDAHLRENPITEEERENLKQKDGEPGLAAIEKNAYLVYGATSLGLIITEQYALYIQLGDGDILVVTGDGQVTRPIPKDERLFANQTTSLCSPEAWNDFRVNFQTLSGSLPSLIMLATDGYANSFEDETGFLKVGSDLSTMIHEEGWDAVTENLEAWLTDASRVGSGDDITVGLVAPASTAKNILFREIHFGNPFKKGIK